MKIAAVVILYHPEENFISNLKTYYDAIDKIFVFDNSETESSVKHNLLSLSKVDFFQNFKNEGIAKRLNEGAEICIQQGFEWMLTMDQDSFFSDGSIKYYFNCIDNYEEKSNVAMFGTNYGSLQKSSEEKCAATEKYQLITSGALVNLDIFKKIGGFDEALFIDLVDHDYTIRAKLCGYFLIQFSNIYMKHQIGKVVNRSSIKSLFLIKKKKIIHIPLRCYYVYRNQLYLQKKFKDHPTKLLTEVRKTAISNILNCIFYGRNTAKILQYIIAAKRDFKKNKMGKYV